MRGLAAYIRERFEPPTVLTLSIATALFLVGIGGPLPTDEVAKYLALTAIVALLFVAFLLRTRVTDEFKDRHHDDLNYPNRPVQRGLITRRQLLALGVFALLVELGCVVAVGVMSTKPSTMLLYLLVVGFSALTAREFFAREFLQAHFNIYFLSHQLIFICFSVWAIESISPTSSFNDFETLFPALAFVLAMASIEIIRKFEIRTNPDGEVVADTYLAVWGKAQTIMVLSGLLLGIGVLLTIALGVLLPLFTAMVATLAINLVKERDSLVRAIVFLQFLGTAAMVWAL